MKFILVKAVDGTQIPILAHLVGAGALIAVDGDGGCRLNSQDAYMVSILNRAADKTARERMHEGAEFIGDQIKDQAADKVKEIGLQEVLPAALRALSLKRVAGYVVRGAKLIASLPAELVLAAFTDATDIGDETWHCYRQPLSSGDSALIRWQGEPS